jgi:hypothetical protein
MELGLSFHPKHKSISHFSYFLSSVFKGMVVTRDDVNELMRQYAKLANVKVYAQVVQFNKCDTSNSTNKTTTIVNESRDEVEATTAAAVSVDAATKKEMRSDAEDDCRNVVAEETSILAAEKSTTNLRPFRRSLLELLAHNKSTKRNHVVHDVAVGSSDLVTSGTALKRKAGRKKFAFRMPMKRRPKKGGPFQLASGAVDPSMKTSHQSKDSGAVALDTTSGDGTASSKNNIPKEEPLNDGTQLRVETIASAVSAAPTPSTANALQQPVLFLDKNGKAVTKIVQEMKNEAISLFHYASGTKQRSDVTTRSIASRVDSPIVAQDDNNNSILQCEGAKGTRILMSCKSAEDRDSLCITPPLTGVCHDCGTIEDVWDIPTCCLQSDMPALDSTSHGVTALRDVNSEMISMDLAEMASLFGAGWWRTTNNKNDADVATTFPVATEQPASVQSLSSGSTSPLFADEQDMQKAMQRLFLASNEVIANRTGTLLRSASHTSSLSTVEELDEESNASVDSSSLAIQQKVGINGRSAFQNYETTDVISETKISSSNSNRCNNTQSNNNNNNNNNSGIYLISQSISDVFFSNWSTPVTPGLPVIKEVDETGPDIDHGNERLPSMSVTDALLSHLSVLTFGDAKKAFKKERKNGASAATMVLRHKNTRARSNGSASSRNKLRQSARPIESKDIRCFGSLHGGTRGRRG